jgi:outer membrane protein
MKIIFILLFFLPRLSWSEIIKLEEKDLLRLVESRNGNILGSKSVIQANQAETGHLKRSFLPKIQLNVGSEHTSGSPANQITNSYGYLSSTVSLNLFNGGRDYLQEKSRLANVERAQAEFEESKFGTLTQVRTLYWQMIYQKEVINILESSLKLNEKNLESALKKIRSNLATKTDEIDFNQTKIQLEQDLKRSKIILSNHMRELAAILNHSIDTLYEIPALNHHEPEHTLDDFQSRGFNGEGHREIKKLEALKLSTEFQSKAASRWWTPQLDLYASKIRRLDTLAVRNEVDRDQGEVLGFKLTFSFDGFQDRANSVAQSYMSMSFDYLRNQRLQEIQSGYSNSYQLYILNHDLVHSAEENNKVAQRYYESIWSEYMRGIKNSPDVLQAFQRIVEAKIRYADIKKDYQVARAQIMGYLQE